MCLRYSLMKTLCSCSEFATFWINREVFLLVKVACTLSAYGTRSRTFVIPFLVCLQTTRLSHLINSFSLIILFFIIPPSGLFYNGKSCRKWGSGYLQEFAPTSSSPIHTLPFLANIRLFSRLPSFGYGNSFLFLDLHVSGLITFPFH